jgi:hypothetical protein
MRRAETLVALLAVVLASCAALQVPGRLLYAGAAVLLLLLVAGSRLRSSITQRRAKRTFDNYDRAMQIREDRDRRLGR